MKKREIIDYLSRYNDDDDLPMSADDLYGINVWMDKELEAYKFYKALIKYIGEGYLQTIDLRVVCESLFLDNVEYIEYLGEVNAVPKIINEHLYYTISEEDTNKDQRLYKGIFEPISDGTFVYQENEWEDTYVGQVLIPINVESLRCICIGYRM